MGTVRHMETYMGDGAKGWDCGLSKLNHKPLLVLRMKYYAAILLHEVNEMMEMVAHESFKNDKIRLALYYSKPIRRFLSLNLQRHPFSAAPYYSKPIPLSKPSATSILCCRLLSNRLPTLYSITRAVISCLIDRLPRYSLCQASINSRLDPGACGFILLWKLFYEYLVQNGLDLVPITVFQ
ncbi:hypothetical protein DM860_002063 [Cuscuta australis]|uniref:Uncharacterized protein n=1 Tax=Cuscuta australis TaxID=267555 RepID=A0A328DVR0_9ASTE|nr:hypothetical protein DM860_002063 [Cuscuta australis]